MNTPLNVFIVEDSDDDFELLLNELRHGGYDPKYTRIQTRDEMLVALQDPKVEIVLSDYRMPNFSGIDALQLLRNNDTDTPFIFVSGTIGEDIAVEAMHSGANDYIMKGNLNRLIPAIQREMAEATIRRSNRKAQLELRHSEERYKLMVDMLPDGLLIHRNGIILFVNQSAIKMLKVPKDKSFIGKSIWDFFPPERRDIVLQRMKSMNETNLPAPIIEYTLICFDGSLINVEVSSCKINYENEPAFYAIFHDVTERKHDPVTALANRFLFEENLSQGIMLLKLNEQLALLFLDIDSFSAINEAIGYAAGDQLLKLIANRITDCTKPKDQVARFGADQFAILLNNINDTEQVIEFVTKLINVLANPFIINNQELTITSSIGVSIYSKDGTDAQTLMQNANVALSAAQDAGGNSFQFCTPSMTAKVKERMILENDIHSALVNNEFVLNYQPIIELPFKRIKGMEALIRWQKHDNVIYPNDFIPITEKSHLIIPIGEWVIRTACEQGKIWQTLSKHPMSMSVNLSPVQFQDTNIINILSDALKQSLFDPSCLKLEITETAIMADVQQSINILHEIKNMGIQISIDDFGTGYSSLNYLKQLPIDYIKIDRSFIVDMTNNKSDAAIVKTIIELAHNLGFKVIAEGVETEEQLIIINELGCFEIQGYYFSRPMTVSDATEYIKKIDNNT